MHTFELQRNIKLFSTDLESILPFTAALSALADSTQAMESQFSGIAQGGQSLNQFAAQVHAHLANLRQTTSQINNRQFFKALEHFQRLITQLQPPHRPDSILVSSLNTEIEEFASIYDTFLSTQSSENALPLLLAAKVLHTKIGTFFDMLQLVEDSVMTYDVPSSSEAPFALLLPAHLDLREFARRLLAIQILYSELCMLFSFSESTHPLRISKIESGSLWVKVFGESRVIEMMVKFVEQTASWLFNTYTTEGKIASVPRKVEAIDSLLRLTERLTEAGVNTSEIKEHIEKSAVAISKSLAEILDGQSSVTVNEQIISVSSELSKGLLGRNVPLQLQNSDLTTSEEPLPPKN